MFNEIDANEAHRLMTEEGYVYLDVRTVEEFALGHPSGAVNIPIMVHGAYGMQPNADFLTQVREAFERDTKLVVGCMMGGRSARACGLLAQAGYATLNNVDGGFGGRRSPMGGMAQPGWVQCGLPITKLDG